MSKSKYPRLAFVDLETTGGSAAEDRVTEVGIVEVDEDGVREWSSLVNPQREIPEFIQALTGISNAMVENAPTFAELADDIHARLADRIFIAHNARFDRGFLESEFGRTGHDFRPAMLCTVKLSRKLFPEFSRHNLDAIAERHQLFVTERHRALGDAQLLWQFWQKIRELHAAEAVDDVVSKLLTRPAPPPLPNGLRADVLPATHGVYLLYGKDDVPLYIAKAHNLRRQVASHFGDGHDSPEEFELSRQTQRIEWEQAAGEIGAVLREAALLRKWKPAHNAAAQQSDGACAWRLVSRKGALQPVLADTNDLFFAHDPQLYGLFANADEARDTLRSIAHAHSLCHVLLGLEKPRGGRPCSAHRDGKCLGTCAGKEPVQAHNERIVAALQDLRLQPWPYDGPVGIRENGALHVVDAWGYVGTASSQEDASVLLGKGQPRFDRQVYEITRKWLMKAGGRVVRL